MDKLILVILLSAMPFNIFCQLVVARDPAWTVEENFKFQQEQVDKLKQLAEIQSQTLVAKEHLSMLKEATKKLREINRRVANFRQMEECLVYTGRAYEDMYKFVKEMSGGDIFSPTEIQALNSMLLNTLALTTNSINAISVVVTDNFSDMNDSERMMNIRESIKDLKNDIGLFYCFMAEVEQLYYQRMHVRTYQVLVNNLNK